MPHSRPRILTPAILKCLRFWPVVCVVGSRQVGKSTFLRELPKYRYLTLDDPGTRELARQDAESLLAPPCVIDEAQKVPDLFDAVKLHVDRERRPGKFVLTGSVRFSKRTLIRESLTGRARTIQMYPFTCAEALALRFEDRWVGDAYGRKERVERKQFQKHVAKGGMPAIFAARSQSETKAYWTSLTESYVYRDLLVAIPKNAKPAVAMSILEAIAETLALGELPTFARILRKTGGTRGTVERHVQALEDMMLVTRIPHWEGSGTKDIFLPFDSAFFTTLLDVESPTHDAAVYAACLFIALVNEVLAQSQAAERGLEIHYAESPKGELVQIITRDPKSKRPVFWKLSVEPTPHEYNLRFLRALAEKHGGVARVLSSTHRKFKLGAVEVMPWEIVL